MAADSLDLLQGTLDVLVLRALSWGSMHGYAVARFINRGSDGTFKVLDGALYTSLHRMEERGWVESEWGNSETGKRAKFYRLTAAGVALYGVRRRTGTTTSPRSRACSPRRPNPCA
jgi:transcriptional regulator